MSVTKQEDISLFLNQMRSRFACKRFEERALPESALLAILETGRLTPSSFGLEAWHFHVATSEAAIASLGTACLEQEPVTTAAAVVTIVVPRLPWFDPLGERVTSRAARFPGTVAEFVADYQPYYEWLCENDRLDGWARSQSYLAAANMMQCAIAAGIQSCPIEGFEEELVLQALKLTATEWQVGLIVAFGYPAVQDTEREKIRLALSDLVSYH